MLVSLFIEFVKKYFKPLSNKYVEKINDIKNAPQYFFKSMLRKSYSIDLKWESGSVNNSIVAADVVAMDSPLPLKKRGALRRASGDLPKLGMKFSKGERLLTDIQIMRAKGVSEAEIATKIFEDTPKCISGIYERLEDAFLTGLSEGVTLVPEENNVGTGIRVDFGFLDANKFGASKKWGNTGYMPLDDINRVISAAQENGHKIERIMIGKSAYNNLRNSEDAKVLVANFQRIVFANASVLKTPSRSAFNEAFQDEYDCELVVVDRTIRVEKNGVQRKIKPFDTNKLVFLTSDVVGSLVYGTLAEEGTPVAGVEYAKVDDYILISKYSKNDPLQEFTSSQALVLPVIENVDEIYVLDTQEALEVDSGETEGDTKITIWGLDYLKSEVITGLATVGVTVSSNATDASIINTINTLSAKKEATLKDALVPYPEATPTTLTFTKDADTTGKVITVSTAGTVTATSDESWCTVTVASKKVTAKVEANSGAERTATITVTQNSKSVTIAVTQAKGN